MTPPRLQTPRGPLRVRLWAGFLTLLVAAGPAVHSASAAPQASGEVPAALGRASVTVGDVVFSLADGVITRKEPGQATLSYTLGPKGGMVALAADERGVLAWVGGSLWSLGFDDLAVSASRELPLAPAPAALWLGRKDVALLVGAEVVRLRRTNLKDLDADELLEATREALQQKWQAAAATAGAGASARPTSAPSGGAGGALAGRPLGGGYRVSRPGGAAGLPRTGETARVVLSAAPEDATRGGLDLSRPSGLASDGKILALADRDNHRVLIWTSIPTSPQTPPDRVLGQPDFAGNQPGSGPDELFWPMEVEVAGGRIIVADTYNHRVSVWNGVPARDGAPADLILTGGGSRRTVAIPGGGQASVGQLAWPWGVWSDGRRLIVTSTAEGKVMQWDRFPTKGTQPADHVYAHMGTPRSVASDGKTLLLGDHNARTPGGGRPDAHGGWVFPLGGDEAQFLLHREGQDHWPQGDVNERGEWLLLTDRLEYRSRAPGSADDAPQVSVRVDRMRPTDGADVTWAGSWVFVSDPEQDRVLGFRSMPQSDATPPDVVLGGEAAPGSGQAFELASPVPTSDGRTLVAVSAYDGAMALWKDIPDEDGAWPDYLWSIPDGVFEPHILDGRLVVSTAGGRLLVWDSLPLAGEEPDHVLKGTIGGVEVSRIGGTAWSESGFYLLDERKQLHVWSTVPVDGRKPLVTRSFPGATQVSADTEWVVLSKDRELQVLSSSQLARGDAGRTFSLPGKGPANGMVADGKLFASNQGEATIRIWDTVEAALAGRPASATLGGLPSPGHAAVFWPGPLAWDGRYLWVAEAKFSRRILRFGD